MFTIFNKKLTTVFLDPQSPNIALDEAGDTKNKVNVILSPSLYWVKKLSLPVKYVRQVKKLLPSIFEDTLPEGHYSYAAYKSEDTFFVFAYEDKRILDTMAKKGIAPSNVANVYFAQSELADIKGAVRINEQQSLYLKEGLLVLVPSDWIKDAADLDISQISLSKNTVALQQYAHIVDNTIIYKIATVLLIISLLVGTEYFITKQKSEGILESKDALFAKYNLKSTMMQNESMLKKYQTIHEKQTALRAHISCFLTLKLKDTEKISLMSLKNDTLVVEFEGVAQGKETGILRELKAQNIKYKSSFNDQTWHVEIVI
ncbi:hypothetical protein KJ877_03485 [bacterium]|nr:hypothetical protein [bacterium]MBU1990572.1 hypothetical protein [bacterium]